MRKIIRTPKQSLKSIVEHQLDSLAVIAENRLLDVKETRLLQVLAPLSQMSLSDDTTPRDVLHTADLERLEKLATLTTRN